MDNIFECIRINLSQKDREIANDFIRFLESNDMTFYRDTCGAWKDKIYYWVKYKNECVCFIAIKDPDEKENNLTVWSEDIGSEYLENYSADEYIKQTAWEHTDRCGSCGSCSGGRRKVIFGKEFENVCCCTFRIDNPTEKELPFLKIMVHIRQREINEKSQSAKD